MQTIQRGLLLFINRHNCLLIIIKTITSAFFLCSVFVQTPLIISSEAGQMQCFLQLSRSARVGGWIHVWMIRNINAKAVCWGYAEETGLNAPAVSEKARSIGFPPHLLKITAFLSHHAFRDKSHSSSSARHMADVDYLIRRDITAWTNHIH